MMQTNEKLVNELLALPYIPKLIQELEVKLAEERQRRKRFYEDISESEKAEFIQGEVIIHSPVKKVHNELSFSLAQLLNIYVKKYNLGFVGHEKLMISLSRNDYEPDICFFGKEKAQHFQPDQILFPAPDLVVEILSNSTEKRDRGVKYDDYEAHEIQEYWIIDPNTRILEQYRLNENKKYDILLKSSTGMLNCKPIPGFKINITAIFDEAEHMKALQALFTQP